MADNTIVSGTKRQHVSDSVLTSSLQYFGMFVYTQIHSAESNILSIVTQSAEYVAGETP
jgi:hypothetical protein